jgi:hypothetical protein
LNDPRWFKLLLRAIGVLLMGLSLPSLGSLGPYVVNLFEPDAFGTPQKLPVRGWVAACAYIAGVFGQALLGIYLLSGAPRLMRYCVRQVYSRCPGCDYDLSGVQGGCPECGVGKPPSEAV